MDYEAEIDELKHQVEILRAQVDALLSARPRPKIDGVVAAESRHDGTPVLPAGTRMAKRDDGKWAPSEDDDMAVVARLVNTVRVTDFDGEPEDKIAMLELCK